MSRPTRSSPPAPPAAALSSARTSSRRFGNFERCPGTARSRASIPCARAECPLEEATVGNGNVGASNSHYPGKATSVPPSGRRSTAPAWRLATANRFIDFQYDDTGPVSGHGLRLPHDVERHRVHGRRFLCVTLPLFRRSGLVRRAPPSPEPRAFASPPSRAHRSGAAPDGDVGRHDPGAPQYAAGPASWSELARGKTPCRRPSV